MRLSTSGVESKVTVLAIACVALLIFHACTESDVHAGTCGSDSDCPPEAPFCVDNVCTDGTPSPGGDCNDHSDCPDGFCNPLTGKCQAGSATCTTHQECPSGQQCGPEGVCVPGEPGNGGDDDCSSAYDCEPGFVCKDSECEAFDPLVACGADAPCPADHTCNMGGCEGCLNDAFCIDSPAGPKCATSASAPVPEGYCYKECGPTVGDCPQGYACDEDRGGICVVACTGNENCEGGLVCHEFRCTTCTTDEQCGENKVCSPHGTCMDRPTGCDPAQCRDNGTAFYCHPVTQQCVLGCTDHTAEFCSVEGLSVRDCNPCPSGTCDTTTGICDGDSVCDCASWDCGSQGLVCDMVGCQCLDIYSPGPGDLPNVGDPCLSNADCRDPLQCFDALALLGMPGTCRYVCDMDAFCACPPPYRCGTLQTAACLAGAKGKCGD